MEEKPFFQLCTRATIISYLVVIVAVLQTAMTILIRKGPNTDLTELYTRNFSTALALLALCFFFSKFYQAHSLVNGNFNMKALQFSIIVLLLACFIKVGISSFYFVKYITASNMIAFYYLGDILVWGAVALFMIFFNIKLRNKPDAEEPEDGYVFNPDEDVDQL